MSNTQTDLVDETEMRRLFRSHRPDGESFRAAVRGKVAELESRSGGAVKADAPSPMIRRAAVWVPLELGTSIGPLSMVKSLLGTMALPIWLLLTNVLTFFGGARALRQSQERASSHHGEATVAAARWFESQRAEVRGMRTVVSAIQLLGPLVLGGTLLLRWSWIGELAVAMFALASLSLILGVRGLTEEAALSPKRVAAMAGMLLLMLFNSVFLWRGLLPVSDAHSEIGWGWGALTILAGCAGCWWLASRGPGSTESYTGRERLVWWGLVCSLVAAVFLNPFGFSFRNTTTSVLSIPDTRTEEMRRYSVDQLLTLDGRLFFVPHLQADMERAISDSGTDPNRREHLLRRIDESWPSLQDFNALHHAWQCLHYYQLLGAADRVAAKRVQTHDLLNHAWVSASRTKTLHHAGGFSPDISRFPTSMPGATLDAVRLMELASVPPTVDMREVRGYLRWEAAAISLFDILGETGRKVAAREALAVIEHSDLVEPRASLLERVLAERMLVAALLTVLLCWLAVRSAQETRRWMGSGAQP